MLLDLSAAFVMNKGQPLLCAADELTIVMLLDLSAALISVQLL